MAPLRGVAQTQVASWGSVLANAAGAGLQAYATYSPGKSAFDANAGTKAGNYLGEYLSNN